MEAAESFTKTLTDLDKFIESNMAEVCPLRWRVATLKEHWKTFSAYHCKIAVELEQLKKSSPNTRTEGLKLITNRDTTTPFDRSTYQSYETLFNRRTQTQQIKEQQQRAESEASSGYDEDMDRSPSPQAQMTSTPFEMMTSTGAEIGVRDIVRKMSNLSASSSSPSLSSLSPSPTSSFCSPDTLTSSKSIRQKGQEKKFAFFQEIFHSPVLENVTCFVLSFIQVETKMLFDSLERCPNLTHIELQRVIFIGLFNRTIVIPKLKNFLVHQNTSERRLCESKNLSQEEFANLLFFGNWEEYDPIPTTVTRIELIIDGWTMFKLNFDSGEFVSRLGFANDILHRLQGRLQIRRLALQACRFKNFEDNEFEYLTYLNLQSILTSSQDLAKILHQCHDLQELRFKNYIDGGRLYLKDIPNRKMKFLCLGLCTFTVSIKYSPDVRFQYLDTLVFPTNIMDDETLENIPSIFRTKKAIVYLCSHGARCKNGYYVLNKLLQIEAIEIIWLSNFRRSLIGDDLNSEVQLKLYEEYEEFLIGAGLPSTSTTSIILEKKEVPSFGAPYNVAKTFKWMGREVTKEEHQVLEFQNRDGFKFSTWEAYMKRY